MIVRGRKGDPRLKELAKDEYVKQWLSGLSESSKEVYLPQLLRFLEFAKMTPTQLIEERIREFTSQNLAERRRKENLWREYKQYLEQSEEKLSAITIKTLLRTVSSFFSRILGTGTGSLGLIRGDWDSTLQTRIQNRLTLRIEDLKKMYSHGTLRDRCLLLVLAQSGFSEVDVSEFRLEDMKGFYEHPQTAHYYLEKPREKTGELQATCLSYEAMHDLRDLLSERCNPTQGALFTSQTKGKDVEGIDVRSIHLAMKNLALAALGKDKGEAFKTKMLRSFYNSALLRADLKEEIKDIMMGHQRQGARAHYDFDETTIQEAYSKAFEFLSINGIQSRNDLAAIKENMKQSEKHLLEIIARLETQNQKLEDKLVSLGVDLSTIQKAITNQGLDILQLQDKAKIKPKPLKEMY